MINTVIREISLYRRGFTVTSEGVMHLEKGTNSVRIAGLLNGTNEDTVKLFVTGKLSGSNVQVKRLTDEEKKELLRETERKIAEVDSRITSKTRQSELWLVNADFSNRNNATVEDITGYIEKLPEALERLDEEIRKLNDEKEVLNKELKKIKQKSEELYVSADVLAEEAGEYPFRISFHSDNAYWNPIYELHTDDEKEEITVRLKAAIRQNTNIDFSQIALTLYTGNPSISGTIPTLYPQYVDIYQPHVYASGRAANSFMSMKAMAAPMADEECAETEAAADYDEVYQDMADVSKGDTMVQYELKGAWDIKKNETVMVDISSKVISCRYHDVTVPKLDDSAYLAAEVKTADIEDLINSEASVYQKGAYVGKVYLEVDATKETYNLSLGKDENVKVTRKQVKKHTSNVLLKGQKKTEYQYEIKVVSHKPRKSLFTVYDQIPVSQNKSVSVDIRETSKGELKEETGQIKWEFELEPSSERTLNLAYDVAWPKDKNINI